MGCFQFGVFINNTAVNILVQILWWTYTVISFRYIRVATCFTVNSVTKIALMANFKLPRGCELGRDMPDLLSGARRGGACLRIPLGGQIQEWNLEASK